LIGLSSGVVAVCRMHYYHPPTKRVGARAALPIQ
jgi:hypothetical protein